MRGRGPKYVRDDRPADARGPWRPLGRTSAIPLLAAIIVACAGAAYLALKPDTSRVIESGRAGGVPHVVDGDTLDFGDYRVRLRGIDAPELDQTCTDPIGQSWKCGLKSQEELRRLVGTGKVVCTANERDEYQRELGHCRIGNTDINAAMVKAGWAVSYGEFQSEQDAAKRAKRGIWDGTFITPAYWRDGMRSPG